MDTGEVWLGVRYAASRPALARDFRVAAPTQRGSSLAHGRANPDTVLALGDGRGALPESCDVRIVWGDWADDFFAARPGRG
jgi:hypothetical protein